MRLEFGPLGWNLGLEVGIWASRLRFGSPGWDIVLEAGIWASRLRYGPGGWGKAREVTKKEKKKKEEKIPHKCESIGHQPIWGR